MQERAEQFRKAYAQVQNEIGKVIVGHTDIVHGVLTCLFVGGHAFSKACPASARRCWCARSARCSILHFNRIQFTPDLMPSDIIGTNIITETPDGKRVFSFQPGPLFAQIVLADEINRATPKTQSALLEAMQEHSVTVGGTIHRLQEPFFVMATQNPIEQEGTYPLPEAQLDRFFFKLIVNYSGRRGDGHHPRPHHARRMAAGRARCMDGDEIRQWQQLVREVLVAPPVQDYAIRLVLATHPQASSRRPRPTSTSAAAPARAAPRRWSWLARCGPCWRGGTTSASRTFAGSTCRPCGTACLLNFEAQAENISSDTVLQILNEV